ncbi:short-subunit dehydrogenase [Breoghania corrubedonensis]|uniref:Short-subunit dehydrogenase n=1 Tax=Breoghania corrubedonensis TaxID=665038 RepID=A0A2T5VIG0_9HYPH|nr:SDR family oxidoreductase [Breoghania corrubedonensis]PTW63508.1 short-subunit dehydrogenase [Breoghania corrubedonensis]
MGAPHSAAGRGRAVLITGCSSGIGAAAATGLKACGYRVLASARKPEDVENLKALGFEAFHLDYADEACVARAAEAVLSATDGALFGLVNNGAYSQPGAVEDVPRAALRDEFEANLFGWHDLTCRLIPSMRARGQGRIVQVSSVLGLIAMKYRGAYIASKFALEGLTDTLRMELSGSGIHVVLVEPGPIATRFSLNAAEQFRRNIDAENSVHRAVYKKRAARMERGGAKRFKLPPEAVVERIAEALAAERPKLRYPVTVPAHIAGIARRLLPGRMLDRVLGRASDREQ